MEQNIKDLGFVAGANLKRLIKNSEYKTQEEFAFEFGTDVRTVGRWVNKGSNATGSQHKSFQMSSKNNNISTLIAKGIRQTQTLNNISHHLSLVALIISLSSNSA